MEKVQYGKVQLRTGHDCPEVEQRYSCTLSLTSALDGSADQSDAKATLTQREDKVPVAQEVGWGTEPVWTGVENLFPSGIRFSDRPGRSQSKIWMI